MPEGVINRLDGFGERVRGPEANYDEDDFRVEPSLGLAMVSAGMGATGGQGRPSAKLAIWSVLGHIERAGDLASPRERMEAGLARADEAISRLFHGGDMSPPGAMFAGVYLDGSRAVLAHVGAARIYHVRDESLVSVSEDHTLAREAAARGLELGDHVHAQVVTRVLGFRANGGPSLREVEVVAGDRFVLCTRPAHAALDERTIVETAGRDEVERGCEALLARVRDHDQRYPYRSATVVVVEVTEGEPRHAAHGGSRRPPSSWLFAPGAPLPEPPGQWPYPNEAWFSEVYGLVMGEDG